ncbi:MAG: hypothetical protein COW00_09125 [Bdellovibrio sp. CG12_big_fil_rev_8_21_14_0_65_39_13]|nr:MAG: hypothetical protein COW78_09195 [Bdellovibrio sp. CG22_combo_CG10-13_8_21_14_all_39_27]PIQ59786.1 MAG: hypothetical protein COW00_09125 [Bdellovibrio sp. CG12_big_fil_rev_8_21_14_0_65_39_13]PIR36186.1 MAG: hypothetical protein COV37_04265 [Bdellovibrio sp. CG11_big_fil_rev_8_21_14_0_20_39_38]PJB52628.1 MAG: hypothetical protein CO099_11580 [Bdellovibrio sp. CG_4_9_14_3_um_filter_39_7]
MKNSFLVLALAFTILGCSKEIKQESKTCTYNGQPVDCSRLEGNGQGTGNVNTSLGDPLKVESQVLYDITEENGREFFNVLNDVNTQASNNSGLTCGLQIPRGRYEIELYEKNRVIIKTDNGEQIYKYKMGSARSASNKFNGIWVNEERQDQVRMVTTLTFNNRFLMARLDCIPQ